MANSKRAKGGADRGPGGQFLPGHGIKSPGNPRLRKLAEAQDAVRQAGTPEKVRQVLDKLHALAVGGDVQAARVWLDRILGRPEQTVELFVEESDKPVGPPVPDDAALQDWLQKLAALHAEPLPMRN